MKTKSIILIVLALAMVFALFGCSSEPVQADPTPPQTENQPEVANEPTAPEDDGPLEVLYLASVVTAEYFTDMMDVWQPMLAEQNINMTLKGPINYTAEAQIAMLDDAITSGTYDLIFMYPGTPSSVVETVARAAELGVPVICEGSLPDTNSGYYYYLADNYEIGEKIGREVIAWVDANEEHFGQLDTIPVFLGYNSDTDNYRDRADGFKAVLADDGRFTIRMERENIGYTDEAYAIGETTAVSFPEIEIFACMFDSAMIGVQNAYNAAGITSETNPYMGMFSCGGEGAVIASIKEGNLIKGTITFPRELTADIFAEVFPGAAKFEYPKDTIWWCTTVMVTAENVAEWFPD